MQYRERRAPSLPSLSFMGDKPKDTRSLADLVKDEFIYNRQKKHSLEKSVKRITRRAVKEKTDEYTVYHMPDGSKVFSCRNGNACNIWTSKQQ